MWKSPRSVKAESWRQVRKGTGPFEVKVDLAMNYPRATGIEIIPLRTDRDFRVQYKDGGKIKQETKRGRARGDVRKKIEGDHPEAKGLSIYSIARQ